MNMRDIFSKAAVAGAFLAMSGMSHAYTVTLNPAGTPLSCTDPASTSLVDCTAFNADSVVGSLGSRLTITNYEDPTLGGSLGATYNEVGQIAIDVFKLGSNNVKFATGGNFFIWAEFTLSGGGFWEINSLGQTVFTATSGTLSNSAIFGSIDGGATKVKLADLSLLPGNLSAEANATLGSTNLSAFFEITPVAGSTGVGGFFEAPAVWNVDLFANNVGFGAGTGTVTPSPLVDGSPAFFTTNNFGTTPVWQGGSGSFNGAFVQQVPEPGTLSLLALALTGVGVAAARKSKPKAKA
jgi:hypothetical protein